MKSIKPLFHSNANPLNHILIFSALPSCSIQKEHDRVFYDFWDPSFFIFGRGYTFSLLATPEVR
jgi:hypothetical protein